MTKKTAWFLPNILAVITQTARPVHALAGPFYAVAVQLAMINLAVYPLMIHPVSEIEPLGRRIYSDADRDALHVDMADEAVHPGIVFFRKMPNLPAPAKLPAWSLSGARLPRQRSGSGAVAAGGRCNRLPKVAQAKRN